MCECKPLEHFVTELQLSARDFADQPDNVQIYFTEPHSSLLKWLLQLYLHTAFVKLYQIGVIKVLLKMHKKAKFKLHTSTQVDMIVLNVF